MKSNEKWKGLELRETRDGSFTLDIPSMNESYHSLNGSIRESFHIFIDKGLKQFSDQPEVRILEIGWGTGLNSLTTFASTSQHVFYTGIEAYPVPVDMALQMAYQRDERLKNTAAIFEQSHRQDWNTPVKLSENFTLEKVEADVHAFEFKTNFYDLVYFDAFAPRAQEDMWQPDVLQKVVDALKVGGVLVTYCSQGQFRRNLAAAGMEVHKTDGPPGKRDMVQAFKRG